MTLCITNISSSLTRIKRTDNALSHLGSALSQRDNGLKYIKLEKHYTIARYLDKKCAKMKL